MSEDFALRPVHELVPLIRSGRVSARDMLECSVRRIERLNPELNAVVTSGVEEARATAADLDDRAARGDLTGPLHGVPITIKDAIATAGMRSTSGARELAGNVPSRDAVVVRRLRGAGAVVVGKTNTPRWCGDVQTYNDLFGTTNNPWDLDRSPGGSSGGSAAAVASGMSAFDIGSDIGGSIRIPASFCGLFGHKPTHGIVPQAGYMDRLDGTSAISDLNVLGPLARHPEDLRIIMSVIAGAAPADTGWQLTLRPQRHKVLSEYHVGVWLEDGAFPLDPAVAATLRAAVDDLVDAGVSVEDAHPPIDFHEGVEIYRKLVYGAASVHHHGAAGTELAGNHRDWLDTDFRRRELMALWADWFSRYDALLCPAMPVTAFTHDHTGRARDRDITVNGERLPHTYATAWTGLVGAVHLPSTVIPVGLADDGLPVGMQIVSGRFEDNTTLHLASLLDGVLKAYSPPPLAVRSAHLGGPVSRQVHRDRFEVIKS